MANGVRLRLLMQAGLFASNVDPHEFVEGGAVSERDDRVERLPYDADLMRALVASGRLG